MGVASILLTLIAPAIGRAIWRHPDPALPPAWRAGAAIGLVLTVPLTVITAGTMAALGAHHVAPGAEGAGAALPVLGWSLRHGDLRAAHFLATHAMQVIPALAVAAAIPFGRDRLWPSWALAGGYTLLVALAFAQALAELPVIRLA